MKKSICKIIEFEAAHKLWDPKLTNEQNRELYGSCCATHGHSYKLECCISGPVVSSGFIMNFKDLKNILQKEVLDKYDHAHLNQILADIPTCENQIDVLWEDISSRLPSFVTLEKLKLWETSNSFCVLERE